MTEESDFKDPTGRRRFLKKLLMGVGGLAVGASAVDGIMLGGRKQTMKIGFRGSETDMSGKWVREADWYTPNELSDDGPVQCELCPHGCLLQNGDRGFCRVRVSHEGRLYTVAYGNPCAVHVDPIEKKPFYHFLPATRAFSIATAGCNLRCLNCQNWEISQSQPEDVLNSDLPPDDVVREAAESHCSSIAYTYTEPLVYYEYTYETASRAKEKGIRNLLVTAGYINPDPLRKLCKVVDGASVDIKGFDEQIYKKLNAATLKPVLKTLEIMREEGVWIEVGNLIIPSLSDDMGNIRKLCRWVVENLGPATPVHFLRFHPTYRLQKLPLTPTATMVQARDIAIEEGIQFVYLGNVPEHEKEDTICPKCSAHVIKREGFFTVANQLSNGRCSCGYEIPGVW